MKETLTFKDSKDPELIGFEGEIKRLEQSNEAREHEIRTEHAKIVHKYEKGLKNYEEQINSLQQELARLQDKQSKTIKKVETEKQEFGKIKAVK